MHHVLTAEVQKETFFIKSLKAIYFLIHFDEISKMNGHKWGQISQTKKFIPPTNV